MKHSDWLHYAYEYFCIMSVLRQSLSRSVFDTHSKYHPKDRNPLQATMYNEFLLWYLCIDWPFRDPDPFRLCDLVHSVLISYITLSNGNWSIFSINTIQLLMNKPKQYKWIT